MTKRIIVDMSYNETAKAMVGRYEIQLERGTLTFNGELPGGSTNVPLGIACVVDAHEGRAKLPRTGYAEIFAEPDDELISTK